MFKFPHSLSISLSILFITFFSACNTPTETEEGAYEAIQASFTSQEGRCEEICARRSKSSFAITKECAACIEGNYQKSGYRFPSLDGKKIRGFEVQQRELMDILKTIGPDTTARVFALLAIGDSISTNTKDTILVPELVFVVEKIDNSTKGNSFSYFDFTRPCPNYCPDESVNY